MFEPIGDTGKKQNSERKPEEKPHQRGADGADDARELALHGVARGLTSGGEQREGNPEQASRDHRGFIEHGFAAFHWVR